jgi:hypothetical protein
MSFADWSFHSRILPGHVCMTTFTKQFKVKVILRPTVCPGVRRPSGTRYQFFFLLEIFFRQVRLCYFVTTSLPRGWVCNVLVRCFWALPEQSLLGRSPVELMASETPQTWRARSPYLYPPGTGWPNYTPNKADLPVWNSILQLYWLKFLMVFLTIPSKCWESALVRLWLLPSKSFLSILSLDII